MAMKKIIAGNVRAKNAPTPAIPAFVFLTSFPTHMVVRDLNNPLVAGVIIGALLSAVMSSADSALNSATTIFVKDLFEHQLKWEGQDDRNTLKLARICSALLWNSGYIGGCCLAGHYPPAPIHVPRVGSCCYRARGLRGIL